MKFKFSVKCPKCGENISGSCADHLVGTNVNERSMGPEYEHEIEEFEYECPFCGAVLTLGGSIWEYPEGIISFNDVKIIDAED